MSPTCHPLSNSVSPMYSHQKLRQCLDNPSASGYYALLLITLYSGSIRLDNTLGITYKGRGRSYSEEGKLAWTVLYKKHDSARRFSGVDSDPNT